MDPSSSVFMIWRQLADGVMVMLSNCPADKVMVEVKVGGQILRMMCSVGRLWGMGWINSGIVSRRFRLFSATFCPHLLTPTLIPMTSGIQTINAMMVTTTLWERCMVVGGRQAWEASC